MAFNEIKDRDAWFVIRGFVYQVNLTLKKWIDLQPDSVIELEKGEDIDTIVNNINNEEVLRQLGQVKHRSNNITLNDPSILDILTNFFSHLENNPQCNLLFSYITNASYGREKQSLFADKTQGIKAWIDLSKVPFDSANDEKFLGIQKHIASKIRGAILTDTSKLTKAEIKKQDLYKRFESFVIDSSKFSIFIKNFEWHVNNEAAKDISQAVKNLLQQNGYVNNEKDANIAYTKLFLYVFNLLSLKGIKRLTQGLLIQEIDELITDVENPNFELINELLNSITERVSVLEEKVDVNSKELDRLKKSPALMGTSEAVFKRQLSTLNISKPDLVFNGSARKEKVGSILADFESRNWINFQGINGCGKSQLALLVANEFETTFWLDLRPFRDDPGKCIEIFKVFIETISGIPIDHNIRNWIIQAANAIPDRTVFVFNDIPDPYGHFEFFGLLSQFARNLTGTYNKILTTSNLKLPHNVRSIIPLNSFKEYYEFNFMESEIEEYFQNHDAPEFVIDNISIIYAVSSGNPKFVSTILYHLKSSGWGDNSIDTILKILDSEISNELLNNEQDSISKLITNQDTKELLYRLSLIPWDFSQDQVFAVSSIEKKITHPNESLRELVNIWIQEISSRTFQVSPLIKDLGLKNLTEEICKCIYSSVAGTLVKDKTIDPLSGSRSINFYLKGGDYDNAGNLLLGIYQSIRNLDGAVAIEKWGFLTHWSKDDISKDMNIILRAYIRVEQVRLLKLLGKSTNVQYQNLERILTETGISESEKVLLRIFMISNIDSIDNEVYWGHFEIVFSQWNKIEEPYNELIDYNFLMSLILISVREIKLPSNIEPWLAAISMVEKESSQNFFDRDISQIMVLLLSNQILNSYSDIPTEDRNWKEISKTLENLIIYFAGRKEEVLEATVLREKMAIEVDINNDIEAALEMAKQGLERFKEPIACYLMKEKIGKILFNNDRKEESKIWLQEAVSFELEDQLSFIDTLIYAACAYSKSNPEKSVEFCEFAEKVARNKKDYSELDYIKIQGELGISYWLNGNIDLTYHTFSKVVDRLFLLKEREFSQYWIQLFKWTGHSLGYIAADVTDKNTPKHTKDGFEYTIPYQGIFSFNNKDLTDLYDAGVDAYLCVHMAMIAEGANEIEETYNWSIRAFEIYKLSANQEVFLLLSTVCAPYIIVNFKVGAALESQLLAAIISLYFQGDLGKKEFSTLDLDKLYANKPNKLWNEAEDITLTFGIIPLFVMLMTRDLRKLDFESAKTEFFQELRTYEIEASDRVLWSDLITLCSDIIEKRLTRSELINRSSHYQKQEKINLSTICILGLAYMEKPTESTIDLLINGIPYIANIYGNNKVVIRIGLYPFVKILGIEALKNEYVGSIMKLDETIQKIELLDEKSPYLLQYFLQIITNTLEITIDDNRKTWLFEYENNLERG